MIAIAEPWNPLESWFKEARLSRTPHQKATREAKCWAMTQDPKNWAVVSWLHIGHRVEGISSPLLSKLCPVGIPRYHSLKYLLSSEEESYTQVRVGVDKIFTFIGRRELHSG